MNKELYDEISMYEAYDEKEQVDKDVILEYIKNTEDVLTRDNKIAHFTASAWVTNKERNKILMIYHNNYDSWAWVGGHADGDSDLLHVACKEVEEETGVSDLKLLSNGIFGINIVTADSHIKRGKRVNSHLHFDVEYFFEADEDIELKIKPDENSGVKWIDIDEVCKSSTEVKMIPIYERLIDKMKKEVL